MCDKTYCSNLRYSDKLLTMINGKVYFYYFPFPIDDNEFSIPEKNNKWKSYIDQIQFFIPPITHGVSTDVITSVQALIEKIPYYDFDYSDEAQRYREEIALRPWTESDNFSIFMEQIEELIGVKLISPSPSKEHALKRVANIFDIPVEMLIMKNGKVYLIDTISLNIKNDKNSEIYGKLYIDQLKNILPLYSKNISDEQIQAIKSHASSNNSNVRSSGESCFNQSNNNENTGFSIFGQNAKNVGFGQNNNNTGFGSFGQNNNNTGFTRFGSTKPFGSNNINNNKNNQTFPYYQFDNSAIGQQHRKDIALQAWDEI